MQPVGVALRTDKDTIFEDGGAASNVFVDVVDPGVVKRDRAAAGRIFALATVTGPDDLLFEGIKKALGVEGLKWDFWVDLLEEKCVAHPDYVGSIRAGAAKRNNEAVIMWKGFSGCLVVVTGLGHVVLEFLEGFDDMVAPDRDVVARQEGINEQSEMKGHLEGNRLLSE